MGGQAGQLQELMAFFTIASQGGVKGRVSMARPTAAAKAGKPAAAKARPTARAEAEHADFERF